MSNKGPENQINNRTIEERFIDASERYKSLNEATNDNVRLVDALGLDEEPKNLTPHNSAATQSNRPFINRVATTLGIDAKSTKSKL